MRTVIAFLVVTVVAASCGDDGSGAAVLQEGRTTYGNTCSACHGSAGEGGVGPALDTVLETWPSCADHIRWITLGSERWKSEVAATYGATDKPIQGGMPEIGLTLTAQEIAAVAAWERITYGRADEAATLTECGLATGS